MDRTKFIGGSDIAAVMGMSRWTTPLQLWSEKTGKVPPPDLSANEAVEMGTELEETVARLFTKRTGKKVRRAPKQYKHPEYPYMTAQVDRLVEGTDELLECKTASAWKLKEWEGDEIPQEYILQVMWQLGVTGRNKGHIAVLIGGQRFMYKKIEFDPELWQSMVTSAKLFWSMVQQNQAPMAMSDDNPFMFELHPGNDDEMQDAEELNDSIALLQTCKAGIGELMDQKNELEAKIKQRIGDHAGIHTGEYKVTWKKQTAKRLDAKLIKDEQPEIYNRYAVESESRVLRVRKA